MEECCGGEREKESGKVKETLKLVSAGQTGVTENTTSEE